MNLSIPNTKDPGSHTLTDFQDTIFCEICSNEMFEVSMQYPLLGMKCAEKQCLVRKEVAQRLAEAASNLPKGCRIKVLDAWRPLALQEELYTTYSTKITEEFNLSNCSEERKNAVISQFVSIPSTDANYPPVHTTGGAIDVTIVDANGKELEMGTRFDAFTKKTNTAYYETDIDIQIRDHRRLLYHAMIQAGFTNLPSEWWHYDYGDRFWGYYTKQPSIYRGIFTKEELNIEGKYRN